MKEKASILKLIGAIVTVAAAVAAIIVFWDKIVDGVGCAANKLRSRRQYAEGCYLDDEEDYTDWDE